jgi:hypothetical protein
MTPIDFGPAHCKFLLFAFTLVAHPSGKGYARARLVVLSTYVAVKKFEAKVLGGLRTAEDNRFSLHNYRGDGLGVMQFTVIGASGIRNVNVSDSTTFAHTVP